MEKHHDIVEMIEKEEELNCYHNLYNQKLFLLQKSLQKKQITVREFESERARITYKIQKTKKDKKELSKKINDKIKSLKVIQSQVIEDWIFENEGDV